MLYCLNCNDRNIVKNGFSKSDRQRYKCKKCRKSLITGSNCKYDISLIEFVMLAYKEGHKLSDIKKFLSLLLIKVAKRTLYRWLKRDYFFMHFQSSRDAFEFFIRKNWEQGGIEIKKGETLNINPFGVVQPYSAARKLPELSVYPRLSHKSWLILYPNGREV